jgi:hypothetical protein
MSILSLCVVAVQLIAITFTIQNSYDSRSDGLYSRIATPISRISEMPRGLASPDGKSVLHAAEIESTNDDSWPFKTWISNENGKFPVPIGKEVNAEVIWSPNSAALLVTFSDAGAVGQYHALIYRIGKSGITVTEPVPDGRRLLKFHCLTSGAPNVGGIKWGDDSKSIWLAVEVPAVSDCEAMGTFRAFELDVATGQVLKEISQFEGKRELADFIGYELRNADDDCVKWPKTCESPKPKPQSKAKHRNDVLPH